MLQEAYDLGIPHAPDKSLAAAIARKAVPGDPVPDASFQAVADWLVAARLI
jgi:type III secretion protein U